MKREILFRGKSISACQWAFSQTISNGKIKRKKDDIFMELLEGIWTCIIPESLGQFIGLSDKNGKKIFEGDILSVDGIPENVVVFFDNKMSSFRMKSIFKNERKPLTYGFEETECNEIEIIGNSIDHPDLLS